ncbi:MAG TPA: LysE family translocator [Magnetospirillaceae bacterium]|jgi:threonine/homoserine/homoserine lactone efflux protein
MTFDHWLAFVAASAILVAIPGPTVLMVISHALSHGRRTAYATAAGVALGDLTAMIASMLGLGAVLAASAALFTILKWIGAAYLIFLGLKLWRAPVITEQQAAEAPAASHRRLFWHAYAVTTLNPKSIIFFVAFVPQFLDTAKPLFEQMAICVVTFIALATLNVTIYTLTASAARQTIRKPSVQRLVNRTGGSLLIGAGLLAAAWKRAAPT